MTRTYHAPWGKSLIFISALATALLAGVTFSLLASGSQVPWWAAVFPLAIASGSALFVVRGYVVTADLITVRRLGWATQLPRAGLQSAQVLPDAMRGSIRTFGNGGLFSFSGCFHSKTLGAYRAYVTDPHRTVVLRFRDRTVVVSPDDPAEFVGTLGGDDHPGARADYRMVSA